MSTQKQPQFSIQINADQGVKTLVANTTKEGDSPDITKLILANTSATPCLVTISDGISNYYYEVPANNTIVDGIGLNADVSSTAWTAQCGSSVNSIWISGNYD